MRTGLFLVCLAALPAAGCGGSADTSHIPSLHPFKGKVVRGGQPVSGGVLSLQPQKDVPDTIINAEVGADGSFEIQTTDAKSRDGKKLKGAPAGTYSAVYVPATQDQSLQPVTLPQPITVGPGMADVTLELGKK